MTRLFFISLEKDRLAGKSEEVVPVEEGKGRRLDGRENRGGERLGEGGGVCVAKYRGGKADSKSGTRRNRWSNSLLRFYRPVPDTAVVLVVRRERSIRGKGKRGGVRTNELNRRKKKFRSEKPRIGQDFYSSFYDLNRPRSADILLSISLSPAAAERKVEGRRQSGKSQRLILRFIFTIYRATSSTGATNQPTFSLPLVLDFYLLVSPLLPSHPRPPPLPFLRDCLRDVIAEKNNFTSLPTSSQSLSNVSYPISTTRSCPFLSPRAPPLPPAPGFDA